MQQLCNTSFFPYGQNNFENLKNSKKIISLLPLRYKKSVDLICQRQLLSPLYKQRFLKISSKRCSLRIISGKSFVKSLIYYYKVSDNTLVFIRFPSYNLRKVFSL